MCNEVIPFAPGSMATFLLLERQRESLVPDVATAVASNFNVGNGKGSSSAGYTGHSSIVHAAGDEGGRADEAVACSKEGDSSERFSRLVEATTT